MIWVQNATLRNYEVGSLPLKRLKITYTSETKLGSHLKPQFLS